MVTTGGKRWIIKDDLKAGFNLFCCMYGIGTLGMPGNFSRAGPAIAVVALVFMSLANIYASVCMSRVMLLSPKSVKTFGDLGEWCMGKAGRWLTVISQMGSCILTPCVFLVLGGSLLDGLFPDAFSQSVWIIFMALMVMPVCMVPTLKEGAGAAFAGCCGTVIADVIGVAVVLHGMRGHPSVPFPDLSFKQVAGAFGNLSLAYGAGIVLIDVQRQHSVPTRMPGVVLVVVTFISCLFLTLASTGYSAVGCQISGNLLFTIYPDAETGLTNLGFAPSWGAVVIAYLFMQLHITIAFSVLLNPALYIAERLVLGMHKKSDEEQEMESHISYAEASTPAGAVVDKERNSKLSHLSIDRERNSKFSHVSVVNGEEVAIDEAEVEAAEYRGANAFKYVLLRLSIIVVMVVVSILLRDHFSDLGDFVGASCITTNCILLPIAFWFIKAWGKIPIYEKAVGAVFFLICLVLGCYVTYTTGESLFTPKDSTVSFPFCSETYENAVYYNYTAVHGSP